MPDPLTDAWRALLQVEHLTAWLVGLWLLYVVWVGGWIVLQKREPAATISWLLGLALLPYLGFFVYYFFGPQRIHRQRLRRERSRASLPDSRDGPEAECRELAQLGRATTGLAPSTAADVRLLSTGEDKYEALLADIAAAGRYTLSPSVAMTVGTGVDLGADASGERPYTEILFLPAQNATMERWTGPRLTVRGVQI